MASCDPSGARSIPREPNGCSLTEEERASVAETKKFIADATILYRTHDLDGCSLVEVTVNRDGSVTEVEVVRRQGGGDGLWAFVAKRYVFAKRPESWSGHIFIDMRRPKSVSGDSALN